MGDGTAMIRRGEDLQEQEHQSPLPLVNPPDGTCGKQRSTMGIQQQRNVWGALGPSPGAASAPTKGTE